jgi:DNA replication protein DnaC
VVDEVGYQPLGRIEANLVFQVTSKRYEKGSIILTSDKALAVLIDWSKGAEEKCRQFGAIPSTTAAM